MTSTALAGGTVLAVFAHPDDESLACGGTLARLADLGMRVVVMCASHGERGSHTGPARDDRLGRVRAAEMRAAATALGISQVILLNHPDGDLRWAHVSEFNAELMLFIRRYTPVAIITFGEDGLYWHLDHVGVHERTTTAVRILGVSAPPLYYVTMATGMMPQIVATARARGWAPPPKGFWSLEPAAFGLAAKPPTITVDVKPWVPQKVAAIVSHHTQMGVGHPFADIDEADARRWLGTEQFHRANLPMTGSLILEQLCTSTTLAVLRCPYCGGRLELVTSLRHHSTDAQIHEGVLGCHCCVFPVVDGIPVLHLQPAAISAREHIEAGRPSRALQAMIGFDTDSDDSAEASRFEAAAASDTATYRDIVEALGPTFEGGYFLYRFSDPTFIVADAVLRAVAGTVLTGNRRAVDICGGSGHLTRSLLPLSSPAPILVDLFFAKVWLARRFTAPGCEPVCCDGNAPMPFARGAFGYAMCSDAFHYIWTKRQMIGEMARLVDGPEPGAVVINHTHNQLAWTHSHGQPLPPSGYRDLFETLPVQVFGETALFDDVVNGGPLDLARRYPDRLLDGEGALTIVASNHPGVYVPHPLGGAPSRTGEYRVNPLYAIDERGGRLHLTLQFPDQDYEDEYGTCRAYLPEQAEVEAKAVADLRAGGPVPPGLAELVRRRVIVELPKRYY